MIIEKIKVIIEKIINCIQNIINLIIMWVTNFKECFKEYKKNFYTSRNHSTNMPKYSDKAKKILGDGVKLNRGEVGHTEITIPSDDDLIKLNNRLRSNTSNNPEKLDFGIKGR